MITERILKYESHDCRIEIRLDREQVFDDEDDPARGCPATVVIIDDDTEKVTHWSTYDWARFQLSVHAVHGNEDHDLSRKEQMFLDSSEVDVEDFLAR